MKFLNPRIARKQARASAPIIRQRFKSVFDPIVPIHLGDFNAELIGEPTVYYAISQDKEYRYCLYCFFHRKDWSELIWPLKAFDEHEYDFEGVLVIVNRKDSSVRAAITVFHKNFKYINVGMRLFKSFPIVIEPGGHGVYFGLWPAGDNTIDYRDYKLVNMANKKRLNYLKKTVQPVFNACGVHLPWQWNDENLVTHFGRSATEGLMWKNPGLLYRYAKKAKLL